MRGKSKAIATAVIIILLLAILGVVIYGSMTIDSGKEVGSGEPILSGDISSGEEEIPSGSISSGDDTSSGDDDPQPEEPTEKYSSATIPFNPDFIGSSAFQLAFGSYEAMDKIDAGEEVSFILIVDTDKELTYEVYDPDLSNGVSDLVDIEPLDKTNAFKITLTSYQGAVSLYCGDDSMDVWIMIMGENIGLIS